MNVVSDEIIHKLMQAWIDADLVESVELFTDETAVFDFLLEMSNLQIHVLCRDHNGPVSLDQQLSHDHDIRNGTRSLSGTDHSDLISRIKDALMMTLIIYSFYDQWGTSIHFSQLHRVFLNRYTRPGAVTQHNVMNSLI